MNYRFMLTAIAMVFAVSSAANAVVIDNFNSGAGRVTALQGETDEDTSATLLGDALGNMRRLEIPGSTDVVGLNRLDMAANPLDSGMMTFSLGAQTSGSGKLVWDNDRNGLGGEDLTDGGLSDRLKFDVLSIDQGNLSLLFRFVDTQGGITEQLLENLGVGTATVLLADLVGTADLTAINLIELEITGSIESDLTLDDIRTTDAGVPEPTSVALLGLGTLGFLRRRRIA